MFTGYKVGKVYWFNNKKSWATAKIYFYDKKIPLAQSTKETAKGTISPKEPWLVIEVCFKNPFCVKIIYNNKVGWINTEQDSYEWIDVYSL